MNETNEKQNDLKELLYHIEKLINTTDTAIVLLSFIRSNHGVVLQDPHESLCQSFDALMDARAGVKEAYVDHE